MPRLWASAAILLVTAVVALVTHDTPVATAVARAAEVGPVPVTARPTTPAPAPAGPVVAPPTPAIRAAAEPAATPATLLPPITLPVITLPVITLPALTPAPAPAPPPPPAAPSAPTTAGISPYLGLGTWVDVYDWSLQFTNGKPTVTPPDVDRMAAAGVQTLYLQASKYDSPTDILEPDRLQAIIDRAHARHLKVVVWYLPTLVDTATDLRRIKAVAALRHTDGIAIDIESRLEPDVRLRNSRLVELSRAIRRDLPGSTVAGIVLPPVVLEVVNTRFWPAFPYREIAPFYDVWMPMSYWSNRTAASGYRDAYRYTKENVDRLRNDLGLPDARVHPIGGIADRTSAADVEAFKRAVTAVHGIGGSIYDWQTTAAGLWSRLRPMRLR